MPRVADAARRFQAAAQSATLDSLDPDDFVPPSTPQTAKEVNRELIKVYSDKLVGQNAPGRPFYDELRLAAQRCPLCGHREVTTLDHHVPKSKFPLICVAPDNLVPACSECNKIKLDSWTNTAESQTLHPYFDDISDTRWLNAEIVEGSPAAIRFFVDPPAVWPPLTAARALYHFEVFGLAKLYAVQASDEIASIAEFLALQYAAAGEAAVHAHLVDMADSRARHRPNSWGAAAYRAMAASSWYCAGGFRVR